MAVTTNSGVIRMLTTDSITDSLRVLTMCIISNELSAGPVNMNITEGDGTTHIFQISAGPDRTYVLPFGPEGKTFSKGIAFTQDNHEILLFLA